MRISLESISLIKTLAIKGNPNSVSDAGVAALCARSAIIGGYLNVIINAKDYKDTEEVKKILKQAKRIKEEAMNQEKQILKKTLSKIE